MKVLFVCSGNSKFGISPIIKGQGETLRKKGIELEYYTIQGKGLNGYLKNTAILKKYLRNKTFDIIHAHYGLNGWVARLAKPSTLPLVLSFMGSDLTGLINKPFWSSEHQLSRIGRVIRGIDRVVVKSQNLLDLIPQKYRKITSILPNGVDINIFTNQDKVLSRRELGLADGKILLFLGNPKDQNKNIKLLEESLKRLSISEVNLIAPYPIDQVLIPLYLSACDLLVHSSLSEGSPNVIKEAMACCCPIVSTDVGDVRWIFGKTKGCYIADFTPDDMAKKIELAMEFARKHGTTNGREQILGLNLDNESVAQRLIDLYKQMLK